MDMASFDGGGFISQKHRTLKNQDRSRAIDPVTKTGRRLDCGAEQDGKALEVREVTSPAADKTAQTAKQRNIEPNGGTFIRDTETGRMIDISGAFRKSDRRP